MKTKKILTRDNVPVEELKKNVTKVFKNFKLTYSEVYYLDYEVSELTGNINRNKKVKHYTKGQVERNLKTLKSEYLIAKGAASPFEISKFRHKYHIAASTLSLILGFSKNTISNIENDGVTSLSSGRLIKMCLDNKTTLNHYIKVCDSIDVHKRKEISEKLLQHGA